jgi:hypothetical protein
LKTERRLASLKATLDREIPKAFAFAEGCRDSITFFGGARVGESDPFFQDGIEWGQAIALMNYGSIAGLDRLEQALASGLFTQVAGRAALGAVLGCEMGFVGTQAMGRALQTTHASLAGRILGVATTTGAGPGIMWAVPLGVRRARNLLRTMIPRQHLRPLRDMSMTQGARIILDFEQATNADVEHLRRFAHFLPRRLALTERALGFVIFPGGLGTLNELFEVMRAKRPLVFHGTTFWREPIERVFQAWRDRGFVDGAQLDAYAVADGPATGLGHLIRSAFDAKPLQPKREDGVAMAKDAHDALDILERLPRAVTFIGSRRLAKTDREVSVAERLAVLLAKADRPVRIGGDGELLHAVAKGVRRGHGGAHIQGLFLDEGQLDRAHVDRACDIAAVVHSAPVHKLVLYENTDAIVALPGGVGTFDEVFEVACLMQTKKIERRPLILVGKAYWEPIIDALLCAMEAKGLVAPDDRSLFQIVDDELEAMAILGPTAPAKL